MESGTSVCMGKKKGLLTQKWILTSKGCIKSQAKGGMSHSVSLEYSIYK